MPPLFCGINNMLRLYVMIQNESDTDRIVRGVIGVILLLVAYNNMTGPWQIVLYILGGIAVVTGITGFCMIYKLLGITTRK